MSKGKFKGWEIGEQIGRGAFGEVYRLYREDLGHIYEAALKVIRVPANESEVKAVLRETGSEEATREYYRNNGDDYKIDYPYPYWDKLKTSQSN